jgi:signal transduction histidine kinase
MFVPVLWGGRVVGVISAQSYTPGRYAQSDLELLEALASHCSGALQRVWAEEDRKRMEAQVLQAQKLESLGILAGGIAHDFNNLLMGILGNAELARDELPSSSQARVHLREIEIASKRAAELCRQMLAYSGKGKFVVERIDLGNLMREMAHLLESSIPKKIVLKYRFSENLPIFEGDVAQIRQVVMNLMINASEAIGDRSGAISISIGAMAAPAAELEAYQLDEPLGPGLYVYLDIFDTGCGMDEATRKRIFDPFFTTKFTGRGLGLAAVQGIVRGHRGGIRIESEPGRGTSFRAISPAKGCPIPAKARSVSIGLPGMAGERFCWRTMRKRSWRSVGGCFRRQDSRY